LSSATFAGDFSFGPHDGTSHEGVAWPVNELFAFVWRV
jgi:hypothetical protein